MYGTPHHHNKPLLGAQTPTELAPDGCKRGPGGLHVTADPQKCWFGKTAPAEASTLSAVIPTEAKARKATPIWTGLMMYFPAVWAEVTHISVLGNEQHNPGEPLHWARGKSMDQMDAAFRHMLDHGTGNVRDTDGSYHLAKAIWRLCAELQLTIEKEGKK